MTKLANQVVLALFIGFFFSLSNAVAQTPTVPTGVDGYTITIRDAWLASSAVPGFRPVRVTIETNPAKATVVDEKFIVSILTQQYSGAASETSTELVIPAGQKSAVAELYVHDLYTINSNTNQLTIVNEHGRQILSERGWAPSNWGGQPPTLIVNSGFPEMQTKQRVCYKRIVKPVGASVAGFSGETKLPNFDELNLIYNNPNTASQVITRPNGMTVRVPTSTAATTATGTRAAVSAWVAISSNPKLQPIRPSDLPFSWIGLQGVEQIMISLEELESLSKKNSLQRSNLEKWVTAGGVLIVYETGPRFSKANDIWKFLLGRDREHIAERKLAKWSDPTKRVSKLKHVIQDQAINSGQYYLQRSGQIYGQSAAYDELQNANIPSNIADWPTFDDPTKIPAPAKFAVCEYLEGRFVAVDDDMTSWDQSDWRLLQNSISLGGINISNRVAVASLSQSSDSTFSIPGVGQPPTKSFQVLIGLFLLIAGPVMMIALRRTGQMQYLFVLVPLLSLGVCFSLFFYAVIVDGSNQWGRVNSVTYLDHRTNQAVTHTHACYYSGVHPRSYEMQPHSLGVAFQFEQNTATSRLYDQGVMRLSGGDITARMPHEVATVCPQSATERLVILESKGTDPPQVKNLLGSDVKLALIRTEKGLFEVVDLRANEEIQATKVTIAASTKAVQLVKQLSPQFVGDRSRNYGNRYYGYYRNEAASLGEEERLVNLIRNGEMNTLLSEPGTYLAILEEFSLAAKQVEPVEYKLQLHIVCGKWK